MYILLTKNEVYIFSSKQSTSLQCLKIIHCNLIILCDGIDEEAAAAAAAFRFYIVLTKLILQKGKLGLNYSIDTI